jgi:hypothetical protein
MSSAGGGLLWEEEKEDEYVDTRFVCWFEEGDTAGLIFETEEEEEEEEEEVE